MGHARNAQRARHTSSQAAMYTKTPQNDGKGEHFKERKQERWLNSKLTGDVFALQSRVHLHLAACTNTTKIIEHAKRIGECLPLETPSEQDRSTYNCQRTARNGWDHEQSEVQPWHNDSRRRTALNKTTQRGQNEQTAKTRAQSSTAHRC